MQCKPSQSVLGEGKCHKNVKRDYKYFCKTDPYTFVHPEPLPLYTGTNFQIKLIRMMKKAIFSWSSGKDSALALEQVLSTGVYDIRELITTVTTEYDRISMHGVRCSLLDMQAHSVGIPLRKVPIPAVCNNETYEAIMRELMQMYLEQDIDTVIFGDLCLEDIRAYREKQLEKAGMNAYFPVWNTDTSTTAELIIEKGFRSVVTCADSNYLSCDFAGREYDRDFLEMLPQDVDPCGENGEFHTFTYDGPLFKQRIGLFKGEVTLRDNRFFYCDLLPSR